MKDILIEIDRLVEEELERANKTHPLFHSDHEGYAVIQEEIDEVMANNKAAMESKDKAWIAIKQDDSKGAGEHMQYMRDFLAYAAAEMIQVTAMCDKFVESQEYRRVLRKGEE